MLNIQHVHPPQPPESSDLVAEQAAASSHRWYQQLWHLIARYPIPCGSLLLMAMSLLLWLAGRTDLANWALLAVVLLGGLPLLWETIWQLLHKEFSIDVIAVLAISGSFLLGQYLAGALIVLMLSGGEALEAYALRRARVSLSALADRA